jgi:hypothetical protein
MNNSSNQTGGLLLTASQTGRIYSNIKFCRPDYAYEYVDTVYGAKVEDVQAGDRMMARMLMTNTTVKFLIGQCSM